MKNKVIELERFLAACMVLLYHMGVAKAGWIFVEFFFILTGCFLMQHLESHKSDIEQNAVWYPLQYTWRKYGKLLPFTSASVIAMWVIYAVRWRLTGSGLIKWLLYLPCELLMVGGSGMLPFGIVFTGGIATQRILNGHLWYICSMLIVLPIIVYLLISCKKSRALLCSVVPALIYGFIIMKDGRVDGWHDSNYGFFYCNLRAVAGLLLGAGAWYLSRWWTKRTYTKIGTAVLTVAEVASFVTVAAISFITVAPYDCLEIGLFALSISLTISGVTYTSRVRGNTFAFLGSLSLPVYCLQMPIIQLCAGRFGEYRIAVVCAIVIAVGMLFSVAVRWGKKPYRKLKEKMIKLLVA